MKMPVLRSYARRMVAAIAVASGAIFPFAAHAQFYFPPHIPGTICATPIGWCWLPQQFPFESPCFCPGPYNQVVNGVAR